MNISRFRNGANGSAVVVADDRSVRFAFAKPGRVDKPQIVSYGERSIDQSPESLGKALKEFGVRGSKNGLTLLSAAEYQLLVADAPDVPASELKSAMKWRLKDSISFPVEDASIDVLTIPGPVGSASRSQSMLVVVARTETLKRRVEEFDRARFGLTVIDIPEMAQRNVAALYEDEGRGVASLFFNETGGLMTISYRGELYHARRLDIRHADLADARDERREELFSHILVDLQRTVDSFERQFNFITLTKVVVGPEPEDTGLLTFLQANLGVSVEAIELGKVLDFAPGAMPGKHEQWRFFHLFGCALRVGDTVQ